MTVPSMPLLEWISIPKGRITLEKGWDGNVYSQETLGTYDVGAFVISKYPVTCAQFEVFIRDGGYSDDSWWQGLAKRVTKHKRASWGAANHPRETVTWYEAMAFCHWLSVNLERTIILPTEIQWQRAAQSDLNQIYPWGNDLDATKCNSYENQLRQTTSVDHYPAGASPYGVMDMSGNVWEWCLNEYSDPTSVNVTGEAPRALRGGSWFNELYNARVQYRSMFRPGNQENNIGFRLSGAAKDG